MRISGNQPKPAAGPLPGSGGPPPQKELQVKPELDNIADRYNSSRTLGNYSSGLVLGAAKETLTTTVQAPRLAWEIAENLWQAETIGPNLKILGTLAAIPAAVLSLPCGPFYGAYQGVTTVADARRSSLDSVGPLKKDTSADYAREMTSQVSSPEDKEPKTMTGKWIKGLEEMGAEKLKEGEKPYDVPIMSPFFAVAGGVASAIISGVAGVAIGLVAGTITCGKEIESAVTQDKPLGQKTGQILTGLLNPLVMPVALGWKGGKQSLLRGLEDGWKHGPVKPISDTIKASVGLATSVVKEAWER